MHTIVTKTTVYNYAELDERGKEAARQWWIDSMGPEDYAEYVIEDAGRVAELLGIEFKTEPVKLMGGGVRQDPVVYWSGFSSQGDGASFKGRYRAHADAYLKIKDYAPVDDVLQGIAQALDEAFAIAGERTKCTITTRGNYSHSGTMEFEFDNDSDDDYDVAAVEKLVSEALRGFADWIYRQLEQEYEYRTSEEAVSELMEANEYTFTAAGKRFG